MVLDIEKYPEFVPWCIEGKIYDKKESEDLIIFNGDLKVGKSLLNETFYSQVSYHKEKDKIIVTNLDGPLKHLKNEWTFREVNNSTQLEFFIEFELKNPILNDTKNGSIKTGSLSLMVQWNPSFETPSFKTNPSFKTVFGKPMSIQACLNDPSFKTTPHLGPFFSVIWVVLKEGFPCILNIVNEGCNAEN